MPLRSAKLPALVALLALLALASCDDPAKGKSAAKVADPTPSASAAAVDTAAKPTDPAAKPATAGKFTFSAADSKIAFVGSKVTGKHDGGFGTFSGTLQLVDGNPEKSSVSVEIDATSLTTDAEKLTAHLKSPDFFDTAKHPKIAFKSTAVKPGGDKGATHTLTGNLDLHGVSKAISFPAKLEIKPDGVNVDAEFTFNRKDFGINYAGKANDLIRDDVVVKLTIRAKKAG